MTSRWAIFALPLLLLAAPTYAQDAQAQDLEAQDAEAEKPLTEREKRALAAKAREAAELRVEQDMVTMTSLVEALSKNLGQIHYLRTLCFGPNDQKWRDYGQRMMTVEANGDQDRHRQLVRAFNAGYYQEKERHTQCTNQVSVDVAALAENGRHISSMLGDPYREQ
ncbi:MAG: TIGR02301 family protein [Litorimonas sp.]